jgi:hypothetical protein
VIPDVRVAWHDTAPYLIDCVIANTRRRRRSGGWAWRACGRWLADHCWPQIVDHRRPELVCLCHYDVRAGWQA